MEFLSETYRPQKDKVYSGYFDGREATIRDLNRKILLAVPHRGKIRSRSRLVGPEASHLWPGYRYRFLASMVFVTAKLGEQPSERWSCGRIGRRSTLVQKDLHRDKRRKIDRSMLQSYLVKYPELRTTGGRDERSKPHHRSYWSGIKFV
jgi:hypothetical protein